MRRARLSRRIGGDSLPQLQRGGRRGRRPLAPFAVARTRPAGLLQRRLSKERNEARSSERAQLAVANGTGRRGHLST
jgi:hypothetical protein